MSAVKAKHQRLVLVLIALVALVAAGVIAACRDGGTEDFQNTINPG